GLRQQERSAKVNGLDLVPLLDCGVEHALAMEDSCVIHENVDGPEEIEGLRAGYARSVDRLQIGLDYDAAAALTDDRLPGGFESFRISRHDGDIRTCIGQDDRDFRADALRGACHESSFALDVEAVSVLGHRINPPGIHRNNKLWRGPIPL